ncbi:DNA polymerase IV [Vagococcus jeotgali]|uniref:DNA polymerase IV n=1 Tax=Vagococcus jeotgali TaxID=3109030 RepID=UPI002DDC2F96|nr:DNA polymerase IV [Vagococcus sp. B2T-5]
MGNDLRFPLNNDLSRKIIHIDMDAFYASIEERDHPELKHHPLVIAKHPKDTGGRGVVTTANYEARKYGIHSAMSAQKAYELCPKANFVSGNRSYYAEVSKEIQRIFHRYTDCIEPLSLDEAYLDVTENKLEIKSAIKIARMIQRDIWQEIQLTCSAGVSYNKFLAKLASDFEKPKGLTVILPGEAEVFLAELPIEDFYGVGKKTVPRMHELGIYTGRDLKNIEEMTLIKEFGKMGYSLYRKVRGIHNAPVMPERDRKSVGRENTFRYKLLSEEDVIKELRELSEDVSRSLKKEQLKGQTVVLKVRNDDFDTKTRRITISEYIEDQELIFFYAKKLWDDMEVDHQDVSIRLLGITLTNLETIDYEVLSLPLWEKTESDQKG